MRRFDRSKFLCTRISTNRFSSADCLCVAQKCARAPGLKFRETPRPLSLFLFAAPRSRAMKIPLTVAPSLQEVANQILSLVNTKDRLVRRRRGIASDLGYRVSHKSSINPGSDRVRSVSRTRLPSRFPSRTGRSKSICGGIHNRRKLTRNFLMESSFTLYSF